MADTLVLGTNVFGRAGSSPVTGTEKSSRLDINMYVRFLAVIATIVMIFALTATPANAHSFFVYQGNDALWVNNTHDAGWVMDMECDAHSVVGFFKKNGVVERLAIDPVCGDQGKGTWTRNVDGGFVQVCERRAGEGRANDVCSDWREVT